MKKSLSILLAVLMTALVFAGCGASKLTRGAWNGTTFSNESTGISFTIPEDWTVYSDDELAALMDTTVDEMTDGNAFSKAILNMQNIYDCMTQSTTGTNLNVIYENLSFSGSSNMSETDYLDILADTMPEQSGLECEFSDYSTRTIGGNTYTVMCVTVPDYGLNQYYLCRKYENYMLNIIITVMPGDDAETVFSYFN